MKVRRIGAGLLAVVMLLGLCGCATEAVDTDFGTTVEKQDIDKNESIHIRDKAPLYKNQNNTEIVTMYLTVSTGNEAENTNHTWEEINTYSVYDYERMGVARYQVAGLLQVGDENGLKEGELGYGQVSPNCTVQIRGQSSSLNTQKNYKISIKDNKGDWRGQTTIALNKHQGDGVRFRNKMAFDLLSGVEQLMSLRTTFVRLYVKDLTAGPDAKFVDYGLYTQVEQLNKTALEAHGLDKRGHLYKINFCEFYRYEDVIKLKTDPTYDLEKFEEVLEVKGDDDHTKLIDLLTRINDYSIPIEQTLNTYFDVENIAYWMAFNLLVGNIDTQSRNFYIYSPQNAERWYILPWDMDGMLKRAEHTIHNRSDYAYWESGISNYWGNVLFKRCLQSAAFRAELDKAVEDLKAYLSAERINGYVESYAKLLKPLVYSGRDKLYAPLTMAEYDVSAKSFAGEIDTNYALYKASLSNPMPFFIGTPEKKADTYTVAWEAAYDFNGEDVTYTFELAKDYSFRNCIVKQENLIIPTMTFDALPRGQYFMRVTAKNASGKTQTAFDYYTTENGKVYGTKTFYVAKDGSITEDTYIDG